MTWVLRSVPVEPLPPVIPVLCFIGGDWPSFRPPDSFQGVRLESERSIKNLLAGGGVLADDEIDTVAHILRSAFPPK